MQGEREIHQIVETLSHLYKDHPVEASSLQVLKLYRDLDEDEAALVLNDKYDKDGKLCRKVIVATNVAETSVTFKHLDFVIDCGESRTLVYNPERNETVLVKTPCSRSQMLQRFGRAGRRRPGIAIGLYTKDFFEQSQAHPEPPIRRADLTSTVLTLVCMGIVDLKTFPWASG
jgi:HrpA-like RNA helicase